jgi:DNA-directed RNA polymerase subunit RPC12/RpoP
MNMPEASFLAWQKQFSTEDDCLKYLQQMKWENGFICPDCGNDHRYEITSRHFYECTQCKKQTSITAGTLFHGSHLTLIQWFGLSIFLAQIKGVYLH